MKSALLLLAALRLACFAADPVKVIKVACLGDSITYGAGVEERQTNNYPYVLGKLLGPKFETRNFGVSGATLLKKGDLPYWTRPQFAAATDYGPDVVVLKLGTNDSKPQNWKHGAEFEADLREMLQYFQKLTKSNLFVCLPVPVYETKWGINEEVVSGEIIPKIRKVAGELKVPVIDLHKALSDKPEFFPDKVHPNAAGAALMAKTIHQQIAQNFPKP